MDDIGEIADATTPTEQAEVDGLPPAVEAALVAWCEDAQQSLGPLIDTRAYNVLVESQHALRAAVAAALNA